MRDISGHRQLTNHEINVVKRNEMKVIHMIFHDYFNVRKLSVSEVHINAERESLE